MSHGLRLVFSALMLALGGVVCAAQDAPTDIPRNELPKAAVCVVCTATGSAHGEEKPAAGVRYRGQSYYFCNAKEVATFKEDPEGFLPPVLPRPAPALSLKSLAGDTVTLSELKGKVALVDFWATWCVPCVAAMPEMQRLSTEYADKGLTVLGVSIDEEGEKKVRPFIAKRKFTYPILLDDQSAVKAFNVKAIPALYLIDRQGQVVKQWVGKPEKKEVEQAVRALLGEEGKPKE